jgi:hypothetical protein
MFGASHGRIRLSGERFRDQAELASRETDDRMGADSYRTYTDGAFLMQHILKQQLDGLVQSCTSDEERKSVLAEAGTQAIMTAYMRIVETMTDSGRPAQSKLIDIEVYIRMASELVAYVNDQIIFYGYGDITGFDD